ncbi:la-related protein 7 [Coccinella septempunctata]|uniref:la-related protein 7 n=1 Tax=Coccinella septempunctata TaxID=41139 RepID=UPI001D063235|nr:la-related protein 7 [Coccinella septempunctata]
MEEVLRMEDVTNEDSTSKKGRHRKKQLYKSILQQMEFYFSDSNLSKDRYLSQLIQENPFVSLDEFLKFNKIRKLTLSIEDLRKAIKKSDFLELSEDSEKVKRKTEIKVKENVDDCTIYVEKISSDCTHDFLTNIFSEYGQVTYISIPKYRHNNMNKGFAFIEFDTEDGVHNALTYFDSIGCKMSSNINPEDLCSITSYIKENEISTQDEKQGSKRKLSGENEENDCKRVRQDIELNEDITVEGDQKKKKKKENKKKTLIKELGLQILSKQEWKKMRNGYLNLQRKKMREIKMHLHSFKTVKCNSERNEQETIKTSDTENTEETLAKLEYVPGTIVRVKLSEPCQSDKKIKMEVKAIAKDALYVDVPFSSGCEEIFVRFPTNEAAEKFCTEEFGANKNILEGEEEQVYWKKIEIDRTNKFQKSRKKQRGKDKLLKRTEKHLAKHTRFDENE